MVSEEIKFSRVNRSLVEAEKYYSSLSKIYDWLAASERTYLNKGLEILNPKPGEYILEVGFGTGFAQKRIISAVGGGLSVGSDISMGMAEICQRKLNKSNPGFNQALLVSDTLPIPLQSGIFNGIFSSFTLELFDTPHLTVVLKEFKRVLKPDGRLVVISLSKDHPLPPIGRFYERLHDRFPRLADCRPIPVIQLVNNAGFDINRTDHKMMWGLPITILEAYKRR